MKYCDRYPNLISKISDKKYNFKVYFLNKTKRLEYFFGIVHDGADTMKNIWNFYNGQNNFENIYEYMEKNSKSDHLNKVNPVILLFDNEQKNKKPLNKFLTHSGVNMIAGQIFKHLTANLFLQTIPLVNGLEECEIEDLYQKEVLNGTIDGEKFDMNIKDNIDKEFEKRKFSEYVVKHYRKIDFSKFLPILDSISKLESKKYKI